MLKYLLGGHVNWEIFSTLALISIETVGQSTETYEKNLTVKIDKHYAASWFVQLRQLVISHRL